MKRLLFIAAIAVSCVVFADNGLRTGNSTLFAPVRDLECARDGGLVCYRDGGTTTGVFRCGAASATDPGCVVPGDQTMPSGKKTWNGRQRIVGVAHGSLTACSSSEKGTWQTCTTHNAPVFCDGTSNYELLGASAPEQVITSLYVNGVPVTVMGAATVPSTNAVNLTSVSGLWGAGVGSGVLTLAVIGSAGTCYAYVDCDSPPARIEFDAGTCSFSAGDTLFFASGHDGGCSLLPYVAGNLDVHGRLQ